MQRFRPTRTKPCTDTMKTSAISAPGLYTAEGSKGSTKYRKNGLRNRIAELRIRLLNLTSVAMDNEIVMETNL